MNERVTVSLPTELLAEARRAVEIGAAVSVSSYIADVVSAKAARQRALAELERVFGGPPPAEALEKARRALFGSGTAKSASKSETLCGATVPSVSARGGALEVVMPFCHHVLLAIVNETRVCLRNHPAQ
jgi:Arc/MetJ-type ribon-helix-helix transcriptional regulator